MRFARAAAMSTLRSSEPIESETPVTWMTRAPGRAFARTASVESLRMPAALNAFERGLKKALLRSGELAPGARSMSSCSARGSWSTETPSSEST